MTALEGVFSVLPTPFTPGDAVDHNSLRRVIDLNLAAGVYLVRLTQGQRTLTAKACVVK